MEVEYDRLKWAKFKELFRQNYGSYPTILSALFLIGLQLIPDGTTELSKEEKQDVIHVGLCQLLEQENVYQFSHFDKDGWPHFSVSTNASELSIENQEKYLKHLLILYFIDNYES